MRILSFLLLVASMFLNRNEMDNKQSNEKRISSIVDFIAKDTIKNNILYQYYGEMDCINIPDSSEYIGFMVRDYFKVILPGVKYKHKSQGKTIDSNENIRNIQYKKIPLKNNQYCESQYKTAIDIVNDSVWIVLIQPLYPRGGLYRNVCYFFVFNQQDSIIRNLTSWGVE